MIKLVDIHKIYDDGINGFLALKDINLDFKDDRFVCILGKSGSGKTTLLNIIGGLDRASSGHMVIDGVLTTKFTETQWDYFRNYKIGFVFQNFSLIEHLSVLDNVLLAIKLQGIKKEEAKKRSLEMLERVNILDQANKLPKQLSGGQRQRVSIARALVNNPDIILADEPTGNLDKKTTKEVLRLLKEISNDKLILMVTHSKKIAHEYADRIIELKDGVVKSDTKTHSFERVKIIKPKKKTTKFRLFDKVKHAFKNVRMKKWRTFLTALGLAIGVTGFILIDGISNGIRININKQLKAYDNSPDLNFRIPNLNGKSELEFRDYLLEDEYFDSVRFDKRLTLDVRKIIDGENVHEIDNNYMHERISYRFTDKNETKYFGRLYDNGSWPKKDDEIILSSSYASRLYDIDNLETVWSKLQDVKLEVATEHYYEIPYQIFFEDVYYSDCESYDFIDENTEPVGYDKSLFGDFKEQINTQKNLYNKILKDENEKIYFCTDYLKFDTHYSNEVKSTKEYKVVGIIESNYIDFSFVTEAEYVRLSSFEKQYDISYDIFLTEAGKEHIIDIKVKYKGEADIYEHDNMHDIQTPIFNVFLGIVQFIISLILVVSVVTAGIMLLMVLLISVIERSREIGILRSLGATKGDILSVFIVESGVIGFIAGIIGVILAVVLTLGANRYINYRYHDEIFEMFNDDHVKIIILRPSSHIIAVITCIILAMLFGLLPAIKASKKTPINALKRI